MSDYTPILIVGDVRKGWAGWPDSQSIEFWFFGYGRAQSIPTYFSGPSTITATSKTATGVPLRTAGDLRNALTGAPDDQAIEFVLDDFGHDEKIDAYFNPPGGWGTGGPTNISLTEAGAGHPVG
jgi:hypothetical protein